MLSKWPSSTKLHSLHVSFHLSSAQTSSVQRYAKVYNSLTTQFIKLLQITLETKLHANDYTRLINNENAALEFMNYSIISIFYSQFKSFTSGTCNFLVDQKALMLYSKHPIYNECTLSFESPSYDEVSCLVLFRFLLLIYVFFIRTKKKHTELHTDDAVYFTDATSRRTLLLWSGCNTRRWLQAGKIIKNTLVTSR